MSKEKGLPKKFVLTVTKRDIERGKRRNSKSCPIARAIRQQFAGRRVLVEAGTKVRVDDVLYADGIKAEMFIYDFDAGDQSKKELIKGYRAPFKLKFAQL